MRTCIALTLISIILAVEDKTYRYVYEILRHGARAPYEKEDIFGSKWANTEELTVVGKRMTYLSGLRERERYGDFISQTYKENEIYAFGTLFNRTQESIQARFQGLYDQRLNKGPEIKDNSIDIAYPPIDKSTLSDAIKEKIKNLAKKTLPNNVQIPPAHIFSANNMYDYFYSSTMCPGSAGYLNNPESMDVGRDMMKQFIESHNNKEMLQEVFQISITGNYTKDYQTFFSWCDSFLTNYYDVRDFDKLKPKYDVEQIHKDVRIFNMRDMYDYRYGPYNNYFMARLESTPKMTEILRDMDRRIELDSQGKMDVYEGYTSPKIKYFSAHDTTIVSMGSALGNVFHSNLPSIGFDEYCSTLRFELIIDQYGIYQVEIFYNERTFIRTTYKMFKELMTNQVLIPQSQIGSFCKLDDENKSSNSNQGFIIATIILGSILIFLLIFFGLMKYKEYNDNKYKQVNSLEA